MYGKILVKNNKYIQNILKIYEHLKNADKKIESIGYELDKEARKYIIKEFKPSYKLIAIVDDIINAPLYAAQLIKKVIGDLEDGIVFLSDLLYMQKEITKVKDIISDRRKELLEYPLNLPIPEDEKLLYKISDVDKQKMISKINEIYSILTEMEIMIEKIAELIDQTNCRCEL